MRKSVLLIVIASCLLLVAGLAVRGEDGAAPPPASAGAPKKPGEIDEKTRLAIQKGLKYLSDIQEKSTGAFGTDNKLAATSLAGMAFLSGGNLPGRGLYGKNVELALTFILSNAVMPTGYIQIAGSNMYSHGFAALFLAECYGAIPPYMKLDVKVRKALTKAVQLLEKCQNAEGGWWYDPQKNSGVQGADISVTVCETNALRAARNCGVTVDKRVIEAALKCVKAAHNQNDGGFSYRVNNGKGSGGSEFPRSAGAVCILQALGAYDTPEAKAGIRFLLERSTPEKKGQMQFAGAFMYYACYYASQAMFMSGKENWDRWWPYIRDVMLGQQQPTGGWPPGEGQNPAYGTAISLIVLQMPYRYLPIYQEGVDNAPGTTPTEGSH